MPLSFSSYRALVVAGLAAGVLQPDKYFQVILRNASDVELKLIGPDEDPDTSGLTFYPGDVVAFSIENFASFGASRLPELWAYNPSSSDAIIEVLALGG
jgi:hypothetical protein